MQLKSKLGSGAGWNKDYRKKESHNIPDQSNSSSIRNQGKPSAALETYQLRESLFLS